MKSHLPVAAALLSAVLPLSALAQSAPNVYHACYVPLTGTVYRIQEPGLKQACTTPHVAFSWTDGANAVQATDPLGGDLSGVLGNAQVVRLLGRALSATPPEPGQVLAWNGTAWVATTPASSGGGASDHGALAGLADDDHPQYLLANGVRQSPDGFAVTGTNGVGELLASGPGTRLIWYPGKAAFRAGQALGNQWDDANIGVSSIAMGLNATASGLGSAAIGLHLSASGEGAVAIGTNAGASGLRSAAVGFLAQAMGESSVALGAAFARGTAATAIGSGSTADGAYSTALGNLAHTGVHPGTVVIGADMLGGVIASRPSQFVVRAQHFWFGTDHLSSHSSDHFITTTTGAFLSVGGVWTNASDIGLKMAFREVDADHVLASITRMPIRSWSYRAEGAAIRHIGPTAQDFHAAFGLGNSDKAIGSVDADGIALLGIQALEKRTRLLEKENSVLRARLERLEALLDEVAGQRIIK